MRKDQREELRRLEQALLEPELPEEDWQQDADTDQWLDDFYSPEPVHCQVYNADDTDVDLEEFSEEVQRGHRSGGCLLPLMIILTLVLCALVGYVLWLQGVIG